jgi:hypothetical protein
MFQVTVINQGNTFWLRGTTWAFHAERGTVFESREAAQAALDKAKQFMAARIYKAARIIEA